MDNGVFLDANGHRHSILRCRAAGFAFVTTNQDGIEILPVRAFIDALEALLSEV